ncbi:EscT/YscT/HrcT family type III secretion system export apparatus protein [Xanthomonas theicola]|uniref:EscT/YscT/HrcT family type III secretion system export apparatus protein n=2 Tax=Xanthomonas theicola TaxID=56464 RepID=A0A2S6ZDV8_9XANT|nr:EscT/YscT/HrcT family type III secretion system export apparatus protein [Xanthomonas theicola]QNH27050.1 SpaR/YscT/HrcT type III secretion system export apparatus protein [Xanthomonas theicola]
MDITLFFDVNTWLLGAALGFARLAPVFFMLPFFNDGVLSAATRSAVIMIVSMGFWDVPMNTMQTVETSVYLAAIAQELVIGVVLGCLLAWPSWIFHAVGNFIDNQRGATLSSTIDPVNGVDTSEMSKFFNVFAAAVYLQGGGMTLFVETVGDSYRLCDPLQGCAFSSAPVLSMLTALCTRMIVIASPVVAAMLLSEFILGLLSRFAPQLNAFSVSLTVKSLVAVLVLLIYFGPVFPHEIARLGGMARTLPSWFEGH